MGRNENEVCQVTKLAADFLTRLLIYSHGTAPRPETEVRFHETRKWRFDCAWPDKMIAAEVAGGQWVGGRHFRGTGFQNDCEKYNAATEKGWRVFRFSTSMVYEPKYYKPLFRLLGVTEMEK